MFRRPFPLMLGLVVSAVFAACGGSQAPAENPEVAPVEEAPASEDASDAGAETHTMPDGSTMPGEQHEGDASVPEGEHQHQH